MRTSSGKEDVAKIDAHTTLASTADAPASRGAFFFLKIFCQNSVP